MCIMITVLSLTSFVDHGCKRYIALLTSSGVSAYCVYLCWYAMVNDSDIYCNTWNNAKDTAISIIMGLSILGFTLVYVCFQKREIAYKKSAISYVAELILTRYKAIDDLTPYNEKEDERKMVYFHLFMALASCYLSMVLTNWGSANITNNESKTYNK